MLRVGFSETRNATARVGGFPRRARWAQTAVLLVIGTALLATVLQNFASIRAASHTVTSAQGESLVREIRHLEPPGEPLTQETLNESVERYRDLGLRCAAIVDADELVAARAGDCETPDNQMVRTARKLRPGDVDVFGARVRMADKLPPPRDQLLRRNQVPADRRPPPPRDAPAAPRGGSDRPPPLQPPEGQILIEFEPHMAEQLNVSAGRGLVVGVTATLALVLAAIVFARLSRRAEVMQQELERDRRLVALGEMSAVLAHEIRNPLASLKGHAQLLEEQLEPERRGKAERIVHEAVRLEALCDDLLSLVRSNRVERTDADPAALLREAAASVPEHPFDLAVEKAPPTWRLDVQRMHQVLVNLLRNAAQASLPDQPAQASVDVDGDRLVFTVRDFGSGIAPGDEERVFEPFHTTRLRGTGLGLAVARRIVELHGGAITVFNHSQGGAAFRVVIPRT
jgi:two-component system, NtrC family, sensor histidine kinase HydH